MGVQNQPGTILMTVSDLSAVNAEVKVVENDGQTGVFVVSGGAVQFTPVKTGIIGGLSIEVEGVADGTEIVSGPFQTLRNLRTGERVR